MLVPFRKCRDFFECRHVDREDEANPPNALVVMGGFFREADDKDMLVLLVDRKYRTGPDSSEVGRNKLKMAEAEDPVAAA